MLIPDEPFIFVSYSRKDIDIVRREIDHIKSQHYKIWYDIGELVPSRLWEEAISDAIRTCSCFVVFITRSSVESPRVEDEIKQALKAKKPFIQIYCDKIKFPSPVQDEIDKIQGLERYALSTSEYEERLSKALSEYIKPIRPPQTDDIRQKPVLAPPHTISGISPKVIFFILILLSVFFFLLAIVTMIVPFVGTQEQNDPLNNRLAAFLTGSFFIIIAIGFGIAAFVVHRKYLRRKNG